MADTKLTDLNEYLFAQIQRLNDKGLSKDKVALEIEKAQAITNVADTIIKNGELTLKTAIVMQKMRGQGNAPKLPLMLTGRKEPEDGQEV
jgi:hypothetical protein